MLSISSSQLALITERCSRATAAPWISFVERRDQDCGSSFVQTPTTDFYLTGVTDPDQDFIANARQDIPLLVAEVERLKQMLRRLGYDPDVSLPESL